VPHGLLVNYYDWQAFDTDAELNVELLKLQREAAAKKGS